MEKVIYIDADEEITSVISKIKKTKSSKVFIVIPKGSIILGSIVNLKMLKKHEKNFNKDIKIVTTDSMGRHLASQVGFEVVHSLDDKEIDEHDDSFVKDGPKIDFIPNKKISDEKKNEQDDGPKIIFKEIKEEDTSKEISPKKDIAKSDEGKPVKEKKKISKTLKRVLISFGFLSAVIGILALMFILPKATIYVSPRAEEIRENVSLEALLDTKDNNSFSGSLVEATEESSKNFQATGKKNVGEKAKGVIIVYNEWDSTAQPLVSGTRFISSDGKLFKTTIAVNVPGTKVEQGQIVAGTANVNVEADQPGDNYNIGSATFSIPGLPSNKQDKIYGKSINSMSGGYIKEVKVVSSKDIEDAKNSLNEELASRLKENLKKQAKDTKILEAAFKDGNVEENFSAKEGQEAEEFSLKIKKGLWTVGFNEKKSEEMIAAKIKETLSDDKELIEGKLENIEYKVIDETKEKGLSLSVSAVAFATKKLELSKAKYEIPGKTKEEAIEYFKQNKEIMDVKVDLWPFWVKKIPLNRSRIEIKVNVSNSK